MAPAIPSETVDRLLEYCQSDGRICPMPQAWMRVFFEMLPNRRLRGGGSEPSVPLILAAWYEVDALSKVIRLQEHIDWADKHGVLDEVSQHLRRLDEADWFHGSD